MRTRAVITGLVISLASLAVSSCGEAEAACGDPFAEPIDSKSSVHLLPDQPEPKYRTNPPTSGAHRGGGITAGVSELELDKPTQVNLLESGKVLVQYRNLTGDGLDDVRSLAGENVVVAPNKSLKKPIVATAWLNKVECTDFDATLLGDFIDEYVDKAPGH